MAVGFVEVGICDRPGWRTSEQAMWEEAAALDPGDDAALQSLHDEALETLPFIDLTRRVMATATAPGGAQSARWGAAGVSRDEKPTMPAWSGPARALLVTSALDARFL
jgi:hypothetical protein